MSSNVLHRCDVTSREDVLAMAERVKKEVGNVSVLINNAGIMPTRSLLQHTHEVVQKVMDVNLMSHFWVRSSCLTNLNIHFNARLLFIDPGSLYTVHV